MPRQRVRAGLRGGCRGQINGADRVHPAEARRRADRRHRDLRPLGAQAGARIGGSRALRPSRGARLTGPLLREPPRRAPLAGAGSLVSVVAPAAATVHLFPGQMHVSPGPSVVRTILGSCVSVCLWDPLLRVGGLNHYLLPRGPANRTSDLRYGATAIPHLLHAVTAYGAVPERLVAKVFGGGAGLAAPGSRFSLAAENVVVAGEAPSRRGIPIVAGGTGGRGG